MYVVIFRASIRSLDEEYASVAARMRELAMEQFGCLEFHAVTEGRDEVALSYWPSEEAIRAWKAHPEHVLAQKAGPGALVRIVFGPGGEGDASLSCHQLAIRPTAGH